jgi:superfamily II DNA or RNA helicase
MFEAILGTSGTYLNFQTVEVTGHGLPELKKTLTVINTAVKWEIEQKKKGLGISEKRDDYLNAEIAELAAKLKVEYFIEENGKVFIPAGYWYLMERIAGHKNTDVVPVFSDHARNYQKEAVSKALEFKRATIVAGTGLGKSLMIFDICKSFVAAGKRVCIIVPTVDLISQMYNQMKDHFNVSGAGGKFKYKVGNDVLVTTPVTAMQYVDRYHTVITDETHHIAAATWFRLGFAAKQAEYFYGLTATPVRSDNLEIALPAWCGPVVINLDAAWGISNGWLVPTEVTIVKIAGLKPLPDNLQSIVAYGYAMKTEKAQAAIYKLIAALLKKGHKVMVLLATVKAGEALALYCKRQGLEFSVAHAGFRAPFYAFKKGDTDLLVGNHKLFGEGVDVPNITAVINCCNIKSESLTRQIVGRAVRLYPGKEKAIVVDVVLPNYMQFRRSADFRKTIYKTITSSIKEITVE